MTVADVMVAVALSVAFQTVLDAKFRKTFKNVSEWYAKCIGLPSFVRRMGYVKMVDVAMDAWDPKAPPKAAPAPVKEEKVEDDMDDLFGSDDGEDEVDAKEAAAKAKEAALKAKKPKKVVIAMSLIMLEVKPLSDETNLDDLMKRVLQIKMDGLFWKTEYKKVPIAFGIFKLICGFSCEDEKVSVDSVVEAIEEIDDMV